MYLEIYVDTLFLINLSMNMILLLFVKKVLSKQSKWYRVLLSGAVGAFIGCIVAIFPSMNLLLKIVLVYLFTSGLMVIIAFSYKNLKTTLRDILMLFVITFFIGGILNSIYYFTDLGFYFRELLNGRLYNNKSTKFYIGVVISLFILMKYLIPYLLKRKKENNNLYPVVIRFGEEKVETIGLLDTGNSLKVPFTNEPVIIGNYQLLKDLLPENMIQYIETYYHIDVLKNINVKFDGDRESIKSEEQVIPPLEDMYVLKVKFIPYHSVGKKNGILIGIVFDEVIIKKDEDSINHKNVVIAIYEELLSTNDEYQIILHKELL